MKLEIFKTKLHWALGAAERVTGKNLSLPALGFIKLEAQKRGLAIRATNLDLGVEIVLPAKIEQEGEALISGSILVNFLSHLTRDDKVKLELVNNNLIITSTHTKSVLTTQSTEDFPSIPKLTDATGGFKLLARRLLDGLRAVVYAASFSDIKPEIASVYLYQDRGDLVLVATDSFRLAEKRLIMEPKITGDAKLILPIKNLGEIMRILDGEEGEVEIAFNQHQVTLTTAQVYLTSRLVDGVFPDYRQIMPAEAKTTLTALKNDLADSFKLATVFTYKLNQITLRLAVAAGRAEIYTHNAAV